MICDNILQLVLVDLKLKECRVCLKTKMAQKKQFKNHVCFLQRFSWSRKSQCFFAAICPDGVYSIPVVHMFFLPQCAILPQAHKCRDKLEVAKKNAGKRWKPHDLPVKVFEQYGEKFQEAKTRRLGAPPPFLQGFWGMIQDNPGPMCYYQARYGVFWD